MSKLGKRMIAAVESRGEGYPYISWQCIGGRYEPVLVTGPNPVAKPDRKSRKLKCT